MPEDSLINLFDGFQGYYRPSPDKRQEAFNSGLIVLDTNSLLDLYRFSAQARAEMIEVLRQVRDRVFVPHQVALEFHRRRVSAVSDRADEFTRQQERLTDLRNQTSGHLRQIAARAHGRQNSPDAALAHLARAFDEAAAYLAELAEDYDLDPDSLATDPVDSIAAELNRVLGGRVAACPDGAQIEADRVEGRRRGEERIPPGFADQKAKSKSADEGLGDFLWWAELLRFAGQTRPESVLIVSNDVSKGDWVYESRGFRIGPDPRLVEEIRLASGASLLWATTSEFLAEAGALGGTTVSEDTVNEARTSQLLAQVIGTVRSTVHGSDRPVVASAAANAALRVDPSLTDTAWGGSGSFSGFLADYLPDLEYVNPPKPGYVMDPARHNKGDLPGGDPDAARSASVAAPVGAVLLQVFNPEAGAGFCVGTVTYSDGTIAQTPIETWSELEVKVAAFGLSMSDVKISPQAAAWLRGREGWPPGHQP